MNQAVLLACISTEVENGLEAVLAASCMSPAAAAMCAFVHSRKD